MRFHFIAPTTRTVNWVIRKRYRLDGSLDVSCIVGIEGTVGVKEMWVFEMERNTATHAVVSEMLESRLESRLCSRA